MWLFKKKSRGAIVSKIFETIVCIPGNWKDREEFILKIVAATNGEYLAAGNILMNANKQIHYKIEFCERDERMQSSFSYAGKVTRVSDKFLEEIENHKHVIYITGSTGNTKDAEQISFVAAAVLKAGGLGIKIETAGKAFEKDKWLSLVENFQESNLYQMFVVDSIVNEKGEVYSCGMHNLGYKDTIVFGEQFQDAVALISIFSYYQLVDKPTIHNTQTFSVDIESPKFRITEEINQPNKGQELLENPFGLWRLTKE